MNMYILAIVLLTFSQVILFILFLKLEKNLKLTAGALGKHLMNIYPEIHEEINRLLNKEIEQRSEDKI